MSNLESPPGQRQSYAREILGEGLFSKLESSKVLVVGAGGIGCELLKNLVLTGFGYIEIIDLDTIDLSNLNRQFLFQKQHIKKSKALVAKETASNFNPSVKILAHHDNVKDPKFGVGFFQKFDLVMNALDNLDARRWVNRMCVASNVPLVESGTTGFLGQVQPIIKGLTQCYDCTPKPVPKTYPVCTIRSTPSTPIHCIVWAKTWLFNQLFGEDDENEEQELDKAVADGEDAAEIDNLRKEARQMRDLRTSLISWSNEEELRSSAEKVFRKVYKQDIERLLSMDEMWKHRPVKPVPLDYDNIVAPPNPSEADGQAASVGPGAEEAEKGEVGATQGSSSGLKDQRSLSLKENVELFIQSTVALAKRASASPTEPLSFDKDDEDALDFVAASSNLRSKVYSIEEKTRFQVKEMAGNIIPAIATTNAIIAGMLVIQSLQVLKGAWQEARYVNLSRGTNRLLTSLKCEPPSRDCPVCQETYVPVRLNVAKVTLAQVIETLKKPRANKGGEEDGSGGEGGLGMDPELEVSTYEASRLLSDPDFDDNLEKSLSQIGIVNGKVLSVVDEDGGKANVNLLIEEDDAMGEGQVGLPEAGRLPDLLDKAPKVEERKEEDEDDGFVVEEVDKKNLPLPPSATRGKRKRVGEEKGVEVELEGKKRELENGHEQADEEPDQPSSKKLKGDENVESRQDQDVIVLD
ncbi:hypothetical protein IE53DRAFT_345963 [Violaceomyces palustris]|uniref:Uncharacterized protein n=1 Tax=Violaceomyces palustris TaxID=1673888 RepID=A0ACD0NUA2_9BASI|nr:hypothetical protein IE53DRAFT_345963 [Violaceomyces palustris]